MQTSSPRRSFFPLNLLIPSGSGLHFNNPNIIAFVAQLAARGSHNPKVAGSIPVESISDSPIV